MIKPIPPVQLLLELILFNANYDAVTNHHAVVNFEDISVDVYACNDLFIARALIQYKDVVLPV